MISRYLAKKLASWVETRGDQLEWTIIWLTKTYQCPLSRYAPCRPLLVQQHIPLTNGRNQINITRNTPRFQSYKGICAHIGIVLMASHDFVFFCSFSAAIRLTKRAENLDDVLKRPKTECTHLLPLLFPPRHLRCLLFLRHPRRAVCRRTRRDVCLPAI